jgi:ferrous iron transport protein B
MMGLYLLGLLTALLVSFIAKWFIHINEKSFFILELPTYRSPRLKPSEQVIQPAGGTFVSQILF